MTNESLIKDLRTKIKLYGEAYREWQNAKWMKLPEELEYAAGELGVVEMELEMLILKIEERLM